MVEYRDAVICAATSPHRVVALGSLMSKYLSLTDVSRIIQRLCTSFAKENIKQQRKNVYQDSTGTIEWEHGSQPKFYSGRKLIDLKHHCIQLEIDPGLISIVSIPTEYMQVNIVRKVHGPGFLCCDLTHALFFVSNAQCTIRWRPTDINNRTRSLNLTIYDTAFYTIIITLRWLTSF